MGFVVRLIVSLVMVGLVFLYTDLSQLVTALEAAPASAFLISIIGYSLSQCVSAGRWFLIVRGSGVHASPLRVLRAHFIGVYVNAFGLGTVGGDLSKALLLVGMRGDKTLGLATVVTDRVLGLGVLACIGASASFLVHGDPALGMARSVGILVGVGAIIALLMGTLGREYLKRMPHPIARKLAGALSAIPRRPFQISAVVTIAVVFHLLQISVYYFIALACGHPIGFSHLLVVIPLVNIASSLPLSWMGLGIRENLLILLLAPVFVTSEQAIVLGAIWFVGVTISSAVGGIVAVLSKNGTDAETSTEFSL